MTDANGSRPTLAEARARFAAVPDREMTDSGDPVTESERAVLGAMIRSAADAVEVAATLRAEHFYAPAHQHVFEAVMRLADTGQPVEPASVLAELASAGVLAKVGAPGLGTGGTYLAALIERAGSVGYYTPRVLAAWQRRNLAAVLKSCQQITEIDDWDPGYHLDDIRRRVEDATAFAGMTPLRPNSETVAEVLGDVEHAVDPGLPTGFPDLDEATGGLRNGEMTVIGGRPGDGKSLLGLCIADHVGTKLGLPVLFASLEMTEKQLTCRRIAAEARVPLVNLVRHQVTDDDWQRIARVTDRLMTTGLHVDDASKQSFAHIRGQFRAMERAGNRPRLVVVDYLGFMDSPVNESRQQAIADLARGGHDFARDFDVPVLMLAQLNRLVESRSDKMPLLSDLRESGEIEQSADIVILLHREDAYNRESPRAGEIDLIIRKNRQGPLCTITMCFQGHYGRIVSMSPDDPGERAPDGEWSPSSAIRSAA